MGRTIGIAFERNRGYGDDGTLRKPPFEVVVPGLALRQPEPPAVVVDHDRDMIRIVERRGAAIVRGIVERPLRRSLLPDEFVEIAAVFLLAEAPAFRDKVVPVPKIGLAFRRRRHLVRLRVADEVAAHGNHSLATLRPQRRNDVGRARTPVESADDWLFDLERIHQRDDVQCDRRLLRVTKRVIRKKTRRPVSARLRHDAFSFE